MTDFFKWFFGTRYGLSFVLFITVILVISYHVAKYVIHDHPKTWIDYGVTVFCLGMLTAICLMTRQGYNDRKK